MKERSPGAMFTVSGYSMVITCQYCLANYEPTDDSPNCYYVCRKRARLRGWTLHKDGYATCKDCKK